ncbi:MAG: hypothetical protein FWC34_03745 [Bacteroidetes bacterium]|nr:hypothetical protein [Bacteroidota bacterium]MCL2303447.1 hypothetical protein [Lentimicrobiaceae bacterium]
MTKNKKDNKKFKTDLFFKRGQSWWTGLGVIVSLIGVFVSLVFSVLSYCQSNKTENRQAKQDIRQEEQYQETKLDLKIEKLKNNAREWFTDCEFDKSFVCYQQVYLLDSSDNEGYRKFLSKGKEQLSVANGKCDSEIKCFFEWAKQLTKDTIDINLLLKQCE